MSFLPPDIVVPIAGQKSHRVCQGPDDVPHPRPASDTNHHGQGNGQLLVRAAAIVSISMHRCMTGFGVGKGESVFAPVEPWEPGNVLTDELTQVAIFFLNPSYRLYKQYEQFLAVEITGKINGAVGNWNAHIVAYKSMKKLGVGGGRMAASPKANTHECPLTVSPACDTCMGKVPTGGPCPKSSSLALVSP